MRREGRRKVLVGEGEGGRRGTERGGEYGWGR